MLCSPYVVSSWIKFNIFLVQVNPSAISLQIQCLAVLRYVTILIIWKVRYVQVSFTHCWDRGGCHSSFLCTPYYRITMYYQVLPTEIRWNTAKIWEELTKYRKIGDFWVFFTSNEAVIVKVLPIITMYYRFRVHRTTRVTAPSAETMLKVTLVNTLYGIYLTKSTQF